MGDGDYTLCEEADVRISTIGPPIREVYKFHALEDGRLDDTKRVIERALEQVSIAFNATLIRLCSVIPDMRSDVNERSIKETTALGNLWY